MRKILSIKCDKTYINHVIIKEEPKPMALDNADVVTAVGSTTAMDHYSNQIIKPVRVDSIIWL